MFFFCIVHFSAPLCVCEFVCATFKSYNSLRWKCTKGNNLDQPANMSLIKRREWSMASIDGFFFNTTSLFSANALSNACTPIQTQTHACTHSHVQIEWCIMLCNYSYLIKFQLRELIQKKIIIIECSILLLKIYLNTREHKHRRIIFRLSYFSFVFLRIMMRTIWQYARCPSKLLPLIRFHP